MRFWAWIPIPYTPVPRETRVGVFSGGYGEMVVRCVSVFLAIYPHAREADLRGPEGVESVCKRYFILAVNIKHTQRTKLKHTQRTKLA